MRINWFQSFFKRGNCQVWSKALDSESSPVGVREFESPFPHLNNTENYGVLIIPGHYPKEKHVEI